MLQATLRPKENTFKNKDYCGRRLLGGRRRVRATAPQGVSDPPRCHAAHRQEEHIGELCRGLMGVLSKVAGRFARRLPAHVELDDLMGAGAVGMLTAVRQHHDKPMADLTRLAEQRIRGAILDYLRGIDHLTRRQRAAVSAMNKTIHAMRAQGIAPDLQDVAQRMGVSTQRIEQINNELAAVQVTSLDDSLPLADRDPGPAQAAMCTQVKERLVVALEQLPRRLQILLSLYYCESLTYKEIGELLGISRSRICQLHTQAISELRTSLQACVE
ncbi:MAG: sigma-70 family RNA polymerase sigma factor [Myxococcota bacterium]